MSRHVPADRGEANWTAFTGRSTPAMWRMAFGKDTAMESGNRICGHTFPSNPGPQKGGSLES